MIFLKRVFLMYFIIAVNVYYSIQCPHEGFHPRAVPNDAKPGYNIRDQSMPITIQQIKDKLKESGVFDYEDRSLNDKEKKELKGLFDAVEIMTTSRSRQPSSVQTIFTSMRVVERAVKKQLKEKQISESLASKFHWDKLFTVPRQSQLIPTYYIDKKTKMRVFNTDLRHFYDFNLIHHKYD